MAVDGNSIGNVSRRNVIKPRPPRARSPPCARVTRCTVCLQCRTAEKPHSKTREGQIYSAAVAMAGESIAPVPGRFSIHTRNAYHVRRTHKKKLFDRLFGYLNDSNNY